jgi:hypothetical protein
MWIRVNIFPRKKFHAGRQRAGAV